MTTLEESIKADEAELAKLLGEEPKQEEEVKEVEEEKPEPVEPVVEEPKEEVKEEPKPEPIDNTVMARMRWEMAEAKRKADALQKELDESRKPKEVIPDKAENWEGHTEGRIETVEQRLERIEKEIEQERSKSERDYRIEAAKQEFDAWEEKYKPSAPDYEEARTFLVQSIAQSIRILNPSITQKDLVSGVQNALLERGRDAVNAGINPAQAIHNEARNLGFTKVAPLPTKEERGSNLNALSENKKRSAGMAASTAGGESASPSPNSVLKMSNAEIARMTESDWARLEAEARAS